MRDAFNDWQSATACFAVELVVAGLQGMHSLTVLSHTKLSDQFMQMQFFSYVTTFIKHSLTVHTSAHF
jgi:hypothetical protein